jgi:hypothetical protein
MKKSTIIRKRLLRLFLIYSAFGWGISVLGIFLSGSAAFELLTYISGVDTSLIQKEPMYDYWLRMASSVFAFIGLAYLFLAIYPKKYASLMPFAGAFMILEGLVLMIHGFRLNIPISNFWGDFAFCLIGGIGILVCMSSINIEEEENKKVGG